jgi:hypothetical protein
VDVLNVIGSHLNKFGEEVLDACAIGITVSSVNMDPKVEGWGFGGVSGFISDTCSGAGDMPNPRPGSSVTTDVTSLTVELPIKTDVTDPWLVAGMGVKLL